MSYPFVLQTRKCPHCGTNLVSAEVLLPETCEPEAFHSRLLGIRREDESMDWQCPDCCTTLGSN